MPGVLVGTQILNLSVPLPSVGGQPDGPHYASMKALLAAGAPALAHVQRVVDAVASSAALRQRLTATGTLVEQSAAVLDVPVPDPGIILGCGMNYHDHLVEMKSPAPATPVSFCKSTGALTASGTDIQLPARYPSMVDFEGELVAVIGRTCYDVSVDEALDYVVGYTIANDVSARDKVAAFFATTTPLTSALGWEHNLLGKQFPTFCPMGPVLVTAEEVHHAKSLNISTRLNGETMQASNTEHIIIGVAQLVSYYSQFMRFQPGDMFLTGSPGGVGFGRTPPVFLRPGDLIEVEVESIGTLRNRVRAA